MLNHILFISLLFLFACSTYSAKSEQWQYYTSAGIIREIAEEGDTLWLASPSGLVKFNKKTYGYEILSRVNSGLPSVVITSIAVDKAGTKWIGTDQGLVRYDKTGWTIFDSSNSLLTSNIITKVIVDLDNNVWVSSRNEVLRYNSTGWKLCEKSGVQFFCAVAPGRVWAGKTSGWVSQIFEDGLRPSISRLDFDEISNLTHKDSTLWIVGSMNVGVTTKKAKIATYRGNQKIATYDPDFIFHSAGTTVRSITVDSTGMVWITNGPEMAKFDGKNWSVVPVPMNDPGRDWVAYMMTDSEGVIWIGTWESGLMCFDGTSWKTFKPFGVPLSMGSPYSNIPRMAIGIDYDKSIWVGVFGSTLRLKDNNWSVTYSDGEEAKTYAFDHIGNKWRLDDYGYLYKLVGDSWEQVKTKVRGIYVDRQDNLWAGIDSGVTCYNNQTWTEYTTQNSEIKGKCLAITQERSGALWFALPTGLSRFDGTQWSFYSFPDQKEPFLNGKMVCDSTGNIWFNGYTGGSDVPIFVFNGTNWRVDRINSEVGSFRIEGMCVDAHGRVWVTTRWGQHPTYGNGGLAVFDGHSWTIRTRLNSPLPPSRLGGIAVDHDNNIWIGTIAGMLCYSLGEIPLSTGDPVEFPVSRSDILGNQPNPASSSTVITYEIPSGILPQQVILKVYTNTGAPVATLVDQLQWPGTYSIEFDTSKLISGIYYYSLQVDNNTAQGKMVIVR